VIFAVEPLQREGQQRQRVLGAARLDIGEQRINQRILDIERARCALQSPRRSLDHLRIGALRHRGQAEHVLAHAFQLLGELQAFVIVRADGEHGDDGGRVVGE
jgi:hypothetical protein